MIAFANCGTRRITIRLIREGSARRRDAATHSACCFSQARYRWASVMVGNRIFLSLVAVLIAISHAGGAQRIAPPPAGKLYQGLYFDEPAVGRDPTEHDVTAADVARFEQTLGTKTAWVFFSNNWSESRKFPATTCDWIRGLGKVPYIRLMLRSDLEQNHAETTFSLANIIAGKFDDDLKGWARDAKAFGLPLLVEWGTEPNGNWFSWNGKWNGGAKEGPRRYVEAYRHIVDLMRAGGRRQPAMDLARELVR